MRQFKKIILWIVCLALGLQTARAFSLLGPVANGGDAWQTPEIGFNPLPGDSLLAGPKNIGEGYRRNARVMYFTFDPSFGDFFGDRGETAVEQAFQTVNGVMNGQTNLPLQVYGAADASSPTNGFLKGTNNGVFDVPLALNAAKGIDSYSFGLSEFPQNTTFPGNAAAAQYSLLDVKSFTLWALMEQMGLADPIRYAWVLHDRYLSPGANCTAPGNWDGGNTNVNGVEYLVVMRNFYISPTAPNAIQYTNYINGLLFDYTIRENCGAEGISPPTATTGFVFSGGGGAPVASGIPIGGFFTGLTRDDAAGLRWLYSTNNYDTPSPGYRESAAAGSTSMDFGPPQLLFTSNYNLLVSAALTNSPATLQGLFPGLNVGANPLTYFSNVVSPNVIAYFTNVVGMPADWPAQIVVVTNRVTNIVQFYQNTFGNVVTNPFHPVYSNTSFAIQTITVGPVVGQPMGTPFVTNVTYSFFQSNVPSGDYFIISNGFCTPNITQILQTNVSVVTNGIVGATNVNGQVFVQNLISWFTNYVFVTQPCSLSGSTNAPADYQGIGRMQFVRVRDANFDYLIGQFITPITNQYTMLAITNSQIVTRTLQRVVTVPDFLFAASDQVAGPAALPVENTISRNVNFNQANIQTGLAGPGTIDTPSTLTFDKVGPVYFNTSSTNGATSDGIVPPDGVFPSPSQQFEFVWGSFDASTNLPVIYPNGSSLTNLQAASLVKVSPPPPALPVGANGSPYSGVTFTATGTSGLVTWTLAPQSPQLPPNLTLVSSNSIGIIQGTPAQGSTNLIDVQMTDSSSPPLVVQTIYSLIVTNH
jgi:hypothetical protein